MRSNLDKILIGAFLLGWMFSLVAPGVSAIGLENADCAKCHETVVQEIEVGGAQHKAAVACLDCHLEHPPAGSQIIPECAMCHAPGSSPHYAVAGCAACHNPHAPLGTDFAKVGNVGPVCSSCHSNEGDQLSKYPSLHSELECTACHNQHGSWLSCLDCHDGHTCGMDSEDCLQCHQPHKPTVVRYGLGVPNNWCSGCHLEVFETLEANRTKHHDLSCVYCHKEQHKRVPLCETCHYHPHNKKLHNKFPDCRECHYGPHALDNKEG